MLKPFKSAVLCAAAFILAAPTVQGQECSSCVSGSNSPYPVASQSCGGNCGSSAGSHREEFRQAMDQTRQRNDLIAQRNDAWPKPFACIDRQLYSNIWQPYVDAGYERQCVLSSVHFDPETGELNEFGKTMVAGIVQNMPASRKVVFVHRDENQKQSQERLDHVRESVEYMFGHMTTARVAFSNQMPVKASALRIERLSELGFQNTPNPIIPIASGSDSLNSAITQ